MGTPAVVKCLMQFNDGAYGWREAYYAVGAGNLNAQTGKVNMMAMLPVFKPLIQARTAMLAGPAASGCGIGSGSCNGPVIGQVRLSQVDALRNTLLYNPYSAEIIQGGDVSSLSGTATSADGISTAADNPYSAIEMLCTLQNGLTTKRAISGIPDVVICDQKWSKSGSTWYKLWKAFAKVLTNGIYGTVSSSLVANNQSVSGLGAQQIQTITVDSGTCMLDVTPASIPTLTTPGPCPPNRWQIFCYVPQRGYPSLNGIYRGLSVTSTVTGVSDYIQLYYSGPCPKYLNPGFILPYTGPFFIPFSAVTLGRTMAKKRGGPFDRPRGRRRSTR